MSINKIEDATQLLLIQIRAGYTALEHQDWGKLRKVREHLRLMHLNGASELIKRSAFHAYTRFTFSLETGYRLRHIHGGEVKSCAHLFNKRQSKPQPSAKQLKLNLQKFARTGIMSYLPEGA